MEQLCLAVTKASSLSKNHFSPQRATMTLPRCLLPAYQISRFSNKSDNDVHCGLCMFFFDQFGYFDKTWQDTEQTAG